MEPKLHKRGRQPGPLMFYRVPLRDGRSWLRESNLEVRSQLYSTKYVYYVHIHGTLVRGCDHSQGTRLWPISSRSFGRYSLPQNERRIDPISTRESASGVIVEPSVIAVMRSPQCTCCCIKGESTMITTSPSISVLDKRWFI